jgi:hypothetical protein
VHCMRSYSTTGWGFGFLPAPFHVKLFNLLLLISFWTFYWPTLGCMCLLG